jgi:poly(3-hydroxybutyrate) depolymerase
MMNPRERFSIATAAAVFTLSLHGLAAGQVLDSGPQVLTFQSDVDDSEQPYALYLPPDFHASRQYPLVISLHGAGSNHRLNLRRIFGKSNTEGENDVEASRYFPEWEDVEYIVASPYARGTMGYQGIAEKDVLEVLADVKRRFPIDEDRVYLTGLSMGGGGTLWLGLTRPDVWAAIAPVCPAPPQGTDGWAPNGLHLPVRILQGGADPVVRPESVRAWVERLEGLGTHVEYDEYPGVGHDSWVQAYADGQIFTWFAQFERNRYPSRVRFVSDRYKYNTAYWVQLDALTPGTVARIDARFTAPNRIEVTTSELGGFTLHLAAHPRFTAQEPLAIEVDGAFIEVPATGALSFSRQGGTWVIGRTAARAKRPGAEGPMAEVIASRHVYVYGTGGNPSREEVEARRAQALTAAEWSVDRGPFWGRIMVFPRLVSDAEVRPSDLESSNLVLFGTKETNTIIAQLSDRLPMHLDSASEEYGLVYVFPLDGQYVLINSGLPWWQADGSSQDRSPFRRSVPAFDLIGLGDYLLFSGSVENVVAAGRFDDDWRLPAAEAQTIEATGVVSLSDR